MTLVNRVMRCKSGYVSMTLISHKIGQISNFDDFSTNCNSFTEAGSYHLHLQLAGKIIKLLTRI